MAVSFTVADSVLLVKKGWQLMGSSIPITDMSKFEADNVEEVWHFDASEQKWMGYSPSSDIQVKMDDANVSRLTSLESWHGFWVKSKQEWALTLDNVSLSSEPNDSNTSHDMIQLKKGWNLVSIPVDIVISADIFKEMTVWKYSATGDWELFDKNGSETAFPTLGHIKNSDGIWVKAPQDTNLSIINEASKLHNFATVEEMESYIKEMITFNDRSYWGIEPLIFARNELMTTPDSLEMGQDTATANTAVPTASQDDGVKDATGTNLQEEGIDESDIVKHDGVNIFYTTQNNGSKNSINITTFERLVAGKTNASETITFNDQRRIDSLYLIDNKLVVLSNLYGNYKDAITSSSSSADLALPYYDIQQTAIDIFDVSDMANISKVSSYKIDGNMITSRVVNSKLYLVSSFNPRVSIEYPKISVTLSQICKEYFERYSSGYAVTATSTSSSTPTVYRDYAECYSIHTDDGKSYYRYDYENPIVKIEDLTPEIEDENQNRVALITSSKLYASSKKNQSTTMTTISEIDLSDGKYKQSSSFMGYTDTHYASTNAFYLVSTQYPYYYDFNNYKERSTLYKFNFDEILSYDGIGSVYGKPLNQFALSEHKEIMRIATTEGFSWGSDGTNNSIYTLKKENEELKIQGVLSGLGKERETIYAVRFMGEKGYVVTFRRTDPLYTIDLSNPEAPRKVGELHVDGYSSYLHPVGEDKLLGVGRDATSDGQILGLKLELFDISDFENPTSVDHITYSAGTYSELESNHKALAYRNSDNLFAFPYRDYNNISSQMYLGLYQVKVNDLVSYTPSESKSSSSWWGQHRGMIFDHNETTYASFFAGDTVQTEKLNLNN
jgi:uncharacterized secreted protein with C-terminal beta-propeller domain